MIPFITIKNKNMLHPLTRLHNSLFMLTFSHGFLSIDVLFQINSSHLKQMFSVGQKTFLLQLRNIKSIIMHSNIQ